MEVLLMRIPVLAACLAALVASCSFEMDRPGPETSGRYQIVRLNDLDAVLVDTDTGETWRLQGSAWMPCQGGPTR